MKVLQNTTCLDSLRSNFVCLYSLMCSDASVYASSLISLLGPSTAATVCFTEHARQKERGAFNISSPAAHNHTFKGCTWAAHQEHDCASQ